MNRKEIERIAVWLSVSAAVAGMLSIAASHLLLGIAFVALIVSGRKLRIPPVWLPLLVFIGWTLASLALSPHPAEGWPQIRKFYVFLFLAAIYTGVRSICTLRWLLAGIVTACTLSGLLGLVQFAEKYAAFSESHAPGTSFNDYYVANQITGFMSHWMTFSGELMVAILLVGSYLFFAPDWRRRLTPALAMAAVMSLAFVLAFTRGLWGAAVVGGLYLLWYWRRWLILLLPPLLVVGILVAPASVQDRVWSLWQPRGQNYPVNSRLHRQMLVATGLRMIAAHPWFGVGPMQIQREFPDYYPPDGPHPIPSNWYYAHLHNVYVHYAAERGVPAVLALLWFVGQALFDFVRALRHFPPGRGDPRWILHGIIAAILATMAGALFELNLGDSEVLGLFLTLIACGYVVVNLREEEPAVA